MERIYHPYHLWEDWKFGMWRNVFGEERETLLKKATEFTGDAKLYGSFMLRVITEWPYACEHNLSSTSINRQAFIGHCACCLALNCPEDITRLAWHTLTQEQQNKANAQADIAIATWEKQYNQRGKKCQSDQSEFQF